MHTGFFGPTPRTASSWLTGVCLSSLASVTQGVQPGCGASGAALGVLMDIQPHWWTCRQTPSTRQTCSNSREVRCNVLWLPSNNGCVCCRAGAVSLQAQRFQRQGTQLRKRMWWQNFRMQIIVVSLVVLLVVVIFLLSCFTGEQSSAGSQYNSTLAQGCTEPQTCGLC